MRASTFTRLLAVLLTLASVLLAMTLLWASQTLLKLEQQDSAYRQLKNTIMVDLASYLSNYLAQGDSQYLTQASSLISQVEQKQLTLLPAALKSQLTEQLITLNNDINGKYRALGKLSGNETALLDNALRQMAGSASSLINYARSASDNSHNTLSYYKLANEYYSEVINLSLFSYQLVLDYQQSVEQSLQQSVKNLNVLAAKIEQLPNLGVMDKVDEYSLFIDEQSEDLATDIKSELSSWPNRYPRDLTSTLTQAQQRQTGPMNCARSLVIYLKQ